MINFKCYKCGQDMEAPSSLAGQVEDCPKCGEANKVPTHEITDSEQLVKYLYCTNCQNITAHQARSNAESEAEFAAKVGAGFCTVIIGVVIFVLSLKKSSVSRWMFYACFFALLIVFDVLKGIFLTAFEKNIPWHCNHCNERFNDASALTQRPDRKKSKK